MQAEDDGWLDDGEEEATDSLGGREVEAHRRRMQKLGVLDGVEAGKAATLQQGFDEGFKEGAQRVEKWGVLLGALSAAVAGGAVPSTSEAEARACLQQLEQRVEAATEDASNDQRLLVQAQQLLAVANVALPTELFATT